MNFEQHYTSHQHQLKAFEHFWNMGRTVLTARLPSRNMKILLGYTAKL
jgi:hypothetical protein